MKKKLVLRRKPAGSPPIAGPSVRHVEDTTDDEQLLRIAKKIRRLSRHNLGGLQLHVWPTSAGTQANVNIKKDGSSWAVSTKRSMLDAIETALDAKILVLKL